jgi:hypothetical protein
VRERHLLGTKETEITTTEASRWKGGMKYERN